MAVPSLRVADVDFNVASIIETSKKARAMNVQVLAFPEMSLTGYSLGDLVHQQALLSKAVAGLDDVLKESAAGAPLLTIVGMPLVVDQKLFNCAIVLNQGRVLGVVPKTLVPTYREFYEDRWWSPAWQAQSENVDIAGQNVPFGADLLFRLSNVTGGVIGVEICEDLWMPLAPHEYQALAGA